MIGSISGKYESGNRADAVSPGTGDLGGVSYGAHQFIASVANAFAQWLVEKGDTFGDVLSQYEAPTSAFSEAWRQCATEDYDRFLNLQHEYTKMQYYDVAENYLAAENYHLEKHSEAMKECVFSRAVQYGAGYIVELFNEGLRRLNPDWLNLSYVDHKNFDAQMIESIYSFLVEECDNAYQLDNGTWHSPNDWCNGSYDVVKYGLHDRFINEKNDLLEMLKQEA